MALRMIRQPSDTPNVSNIDDIVPFRYAYGYQDGYVVGKGKELEHDINGNIFTLQTGRIVLNGVESDIEQNGVEITLDVVNETRYCVLYYRVNLGVNTTQILLEYSTAGYPDVLSKNDDLTIEPTGSANLELYRFQVYNGIVSNVKKQIQPILNYQQQVQKDLDSFLLLNFKMPNVTKLGEYIYSKKKLIYNNRDSATTIGTEDYIEVNLSKTLNLQPFHKYQIEFDIEYEDTTLYFQTPVCYYNGNFTNKFCAVEVPSFVEFSDVQIYIASENIYLTPTMIKVEHKNPFGEAVFWYPHNTKLTVRAVYEIIE